MFAHVSRCVRSQSRRRESTRQGAIEPPCPLRVQYFDSMKHTPRVVIPPPTQKCKKRCVQEGTVRPSAQSTTLRKPFFCRNKPGAGKIRHRYNGQRVVIPPLIRKRQNSEKRQLLSPPKQGSRRNTAKRFRWEDDERQRERVLPLAAGQEIRRPLGRRPASHLSGLRRSRRPAKGTGRGVSPHPPRQRKVRSVRNTWLAMYSATPLPCASSPNETRFAGLSFGFRKRF